MFDYKNIKNFFLKTTLGLIIFSLSVFILLSLISYNSKDQGFGVVSSSKGVDNWFGLAGSYSSSILLVFFGFLSYLMPLFFLITSGKLILGVKNKLFILKLISMILGLCFLSVSSHMININGGIMGSFFFIFLNSVILDYIKIPFAYWTIVVFLTSLGFLLFYTSLGLKIPNIKKIYYFFTYVKFLFYPIFYILKIFKKKEKTKIQNNLHAKVKRNRKSEPTIQKNNFEISYPKKSGVNLDKNNNLGYILPSLGLLKVPKKAASLSRQTERQSEEFSLKLEKILSEYGVEGKIVNYKYGPVVTLYEFLPAAGIKTSKVIGLSEDITRAMSSLSTRIALQPGKTSLGIEIPNLKREDVLLADLITDNKFFENKEGLILALGKNIAGEKIFTDLEKMPHLLIAGTTGSGKSVGINSMIMSLLFKFSPNECKLILIDPKMLELSIYEDIPHLLTPVVTNPNKAVFALKWVVREMENRYRLMSSLNVKNIKSFNSKILSTLSLGKKLYREVQTGIDSETRKPIIEKREIPLKKMPLIVVVIDEMADLMMVAGKEVENLVQRLAQMARASGIHLIAATQRPSVDVITGTIKANFPSRISFRVASRFDSRTILNEMGAEQLLGSGDMLFLENGANLKRLHGGFISENEIEAVVNHIKSQSVFEAKEDITIDENNEIMSPSLQFENKDVDELYNKAISLILEQQKVSTSYIQRYLQIGYNRAARIVEKMEEDGLISEPNNAGKRSVLKKNR